MRKSLIPPYMYFRLYQQTLAWTEVLGPLGGPSDREDAEAASALKDPPVRAVVGIPQHTATPLILKDI
jgi:hypothetical protein